MRRRHLLHGLLLGPWWLSSGLPRVATAQERAALTQLGTVSDTIRTRAMARRATPTTGAPDAVLTELKGVDGAYPLYGTLTVTGGRVEGAVGQGSLKRALRMVTEGSVVFAGAVRYSTHC